MWPALPASSDLMPSGTDFDEFYVSTCRRVIGQVYAMVGDLGEAEDAQYKIARRSVKWLSHRTFLRFI